MDIYTKDAINNKLTKKQDTLTFDTTPTASSGNPITSGGVYAGLATKQGLSVRINITGITDSTTGRTDNRLTFVGDYAIIDSALTTLGSNLIGLQDNWKALMTSDYATEIWHGLYYMLLLGVCYGCFYTVGGDVETQETVSAIIKSNYLGYVILNGTTPVGHVVFNTETALKTAFANSSMMLND